MKSMRFIGCLALTAGFLAGCGKSDVKFVTCGTGSTTGVYYPAGSAIARMVNNNPQYKIRMSVESTGGSVYNLNAVLNGELDFGIAQSDLQYDCWKGEGRWKDSKNHSELRSVFALHPESITLVVTDKSGIESIHDLKNKRINLGDHGSGSLANAVAVLGTAGLNEKSIKPEYVKLGETPGLIQDGRIDGFFFTVGHPNGNIKEATSGRIKVRLVPIAGPGVDALLKKHPYLAKSVIPKQFYPMATNKKDISTIGVKATLVTNVKVPDAVVYAVTKEVFENLDKFKELHPAFKVLTPQNMLEGLTAPVHPGALKYYKEAGLLKHIKPELQNVK